MKALKYVAICLMAASLTIGVLHSFNSQFVPPDVSDCIIYDDVPFFENGVIPEGYVVDTSCGDAFLGYVLAIDMDGRYYCLYTGVNDYCFLIQTSEYWGG